jgi:hypothetical protein
MQSSAVEKLVPHPLPDGRVARTMLVAIRRIAAGGLDDAHAANILIGALGMGYRRPMSSYACSWPKSRASRHSRSPSRPAVARA